MVAVEKLVRFQKDLYELLTNFVNFADFYGKTGAVFQAGTLYLDNRSCNLCIDVTEPGKHAALAGLAGAYLAYCDCTRPGGVKRNIVAVFSDGDSDNLMVGRNGVFYDRKGVDWDATITKVIANPISIREAFWLPYKKMVRMIEEMAAKRAAAAEAASDAKMASAATAVSTADKAQPAEPKKIDVGTVAAVGVAVGAAVLTGSLLVGDSLRGSLRERAERQLGGVANAYMGSKLVRNKLAEELPGDVAPVFLLQGSIQKSGDDLIDDLNRLGRVTVLGVNSRFAPVGVNAIDWDGTRRVAALSQISDLLKKTEQSQRVLEEASEGFVLDVVHEEEGAGRRDRVAARHRAIERNQVLLLDLWGKTRAPGAVYADITWVGFTGEAPPAGVEAAFSAVCAARDAAVATVQTAARAGTPCYGWEVDRTAAKILAGHGFQAAILHRTGHSLGESVHGNGANMDDYETHDDRRLIEGLGFTIEPGVYFPDFGVRTEINMIVLGHEAVVTGPLQTEILALA